MGPRATALVAVLAAAAASCGGSNNTGQDGAAGSGNAAGTGAGAGSLAGQGGGGRTGGGGFAGDTGAGGFAGTGAAITCQALEDLLASCPLTGTCISDSAANVTCYGSGITVRTITGQPPCNHTTEVRSSDGSLCYSYFQGGGSACEGNAYVWLNAAGEVIAGGSDGGYVCEATGESCASCSLTIKATQPFNTTCAPGVCP